MDVHTRESLAMESGQSWQGPDVVRVLQRIQKDGWAPQELLCDNGSEFCSQELDLWAYANGVILDFSRPGSPRTMRLSKHSTVAFDWSASTKN